MGKQGARTAELRQLNCTTEARRHMGKAMILQGLQATTRR